MEARLKGLLTKEIDEIKIKIPQLEKTSKQLVADLKAANERLNGFRLEFASAETLKSEIKTVTDRISGLGKEVSDSQTKIHSLDEAN